MGDSKPPGGVPPELQDTVRAPSASAPTGAGHGDTSEAPVEPLYGDSLQPGSQVGQYIIELECSSGGFATVYRARDARTGSPVAVKVLHEHLARFAAMLRRFQREIDTITELRHPHIVQMYECGALHDGRPYFAMEWLDGQTLADEIRANGPLSVVEAVHVLEMLCGALGAAHALGIVHRDLKASNVMLVRSEDSFRIVLVDFGIAKLLHGQEGSDYTTTGQRFGSPHVMAPEQIRGDTVDARTDIYALGILFYLLVTGRLPFNADTFVEIEEMHLMSPPPKASAVAPVSDAVDAVILRCMEKDPARRYQSVDEFLADLRQEAPEHESPVEALRNSERFLAESGMAIGVHLDVRARCDDADLTDDLLDQAEDLLDDLRGALEHAGLTVAVEGGNSVLAVEILPKSAPHTRRDAVVAKVMALSAGQREKTTDARISVDFTVHVAPLVMVAKDGVCSFVNGELLRVNQWLGHHPGNAVVVTTAAAAGLDQRLALSPVAGRDDARVARFLA